MNDWEGGGKKISSIFAFVTGLCDSEYLFNFNHAPLYNNSHCSCHCVKRGVSVPRQHTEDLATACSLYLKDTSTVLSGYGSNP